MLMPATQDVYFDLHKAITTDDKFAQMIERKMNDIVAYDQEGDRLRLQKEVTELLRECDYNPALLLPYFYPSFTDGTPMTLWDRPHAFSMMSLVPNGSLTIQASRQIGKCVDKNTTVQVRKQNQTQTITVCQIFDMAKAAAQ